jgi:uncharacterized protein (DUF1778 family)
MTMRENSKDIMIKLRMTSKEKTKLQTNAKKEGKTMSDYIRDRTINK